MGFRFNSIVEEGGSSNHKPISLLCKFISEAPPAPLKINQVWLEDVDFRKLIGERWVKISHSIPDPMMMQFIANLKRLKEAIKQWIMVWRARSHREIVEIE